MSFTNVSTGRNHSLGGEYLELRPGERIVATDVFDDPNLPGEMRTTYSFKEVSDGLGWQESLEPLAQLVEPEIADR